MSFKYSAHPALAAEQLRAENDAIAKNLTQTPTTTTGTSSGTSSSLSKAMLTQHRRHKSASGMLATQKTHSGTNNCDTTTTTTRRSSSPSVIKAKTPNSSLKRSGTTPQATPAASPATLGATTTTNTIHHPTKDCHDITDSATNSNSSTTPHAFNVSASACHAVALTAANLTPSVQLQQRLMRSSSSRSSPCHQQQHIEAVDSSGCSTATSSAFSSPTPSTDSTPLSSPTRLPQQLHHVHQHCCQKAHHCGSSQLKPAAHYQLHHHHHHQHQVQHSSTAAAVAAAGATDCVDVVHGGGGDASAAGCKKWQQKFDPRLGPSPYRQLLPIALCILSFAAVFATLIVYMDTTEIRHQQFRLEMSRDYVFYGVAQDDPNLINFLRQNHMRKYPKHFLKNHVDSNGSSSSTSSSSIKSGALPSTGSTAHSHDVVDQHWNSTHGELAPAMANYVAELLGNKRNGAVLQSMTGAAGKLITGLWLAETLNWMAILVEPEPRRYFSLSKQSAQLEDGQTQVIQACVSPIQYPKEITMHYEDMDVRINSLHEEESSWFNSRVKCFALYSIMLAVERTQYDLLSLGVHGHELEILQTLPFEKVQIELISIHLNDDNSITNAYIQAITSFLESKSFKLQRSFGRNYFYQRIVSASSRTRKKDVLLLKTP